MPWDSCLEDTTSKVATLDCVPILFHNVVITLLTFAGVTALIFIIISGIRMIFHGEDSKKIEEDKKAFLFAIVGLLVIILSFFIVSLLAGVTGITCITTFGFKSC